MADSSKLPNHDSEIYAIVTIFVVVSFIAVVLRLYSRRLKVAALSYDDGLVIIAWASQLFQEQLPCPLTCSDCYCGRGYYGRGWYVKYGSDKVCHSVLTLPQLQGLEDLVDICLIWTQILPGYSIK